MFCASVSLFFTVGSLVRSLNPTPSSVRPGPWLVLGGSHEEVISIRNGRPSHVCSGVCSSTSELLRVPTAPNALGCPACVADGAPGSHLGQVGFVAAPDRPGTFSTSSSLSP